FAFLVPSVNFQGPMERYEWVLLPQGMKNTPTICQYVVHSALIRVCSDYTKIMISHYMDYDILLCASDESQSKKCLPLFTKCLEIYGLKIAPEKIQSALPWKYLGWKLTENWISPQKLTTENSIQTLNDLQKLLGTINWIRPLLGISTETLSPVFDLLKGNSNLTSSRQLNPEAYQAL
ncbi:hypothetical protein N300_04637, partial [Calypte anna]